MMKAKFLRPPRCEFLKLSGQRKLVSAWHCVRAGLFAHHFPFWNFTGNKKVRWLASLTWRQTSTLRIGVQCAKLEAWEGLLSGQNSLPRGVERHSASVDIHGLHGHEFTRRFEDVLRVAWLELYRELSSIAFCVAEPLERSHDVELGLWEAGAILAVAPLAKGILYWF
eukprot:3582935-Amphidinium_carterae.2